MTTTSPYVQCNGATTLGPPCKNHRDTCPHKAAHQRIAADRARAQAGAAQRNPGTVAPVLVAAQSADPDFYEIPDTLEGWRGTHDALVDRMAVLSGAAPVALTTPYGTLGVQFGRSVPGVDVWDTGMPGEHALRVSGRLAFGGSVYTVEGPAGRPNITPADGLAHYYQAGVDGVRDAVGAALQSPDGDHAELYALAEAGRCVRVVAYITRNFTIAPSGGAKSPYFRDAQEVLCTLGVVVLAPETRQVAARWVGAGYAGSVADLRDAASDVADLRGGAYTVALTMIDAGYAGPPEDLAPIATATVLHPVYHGAP